MGYHFKPMWWTRKCLIYVFISLFIEPIHRAAIKSKAAHQARGINEGYPGHKFLKNGGKSGYWTYLENWLNSVDKLMSGVEEKPGLSGFLTKVLDQLQSRVEDGSMSEMDLNKTAMISHKIESGKQHFKLHIMSTFWSSYRLEDDFRSEIEAMDGGLWRKNKQVAGTQTKYVGVPVCHVPLGARKLAWKLLNGTGGFPCPLFPNDKVADDPLFMQPPLESEEDETEEDLVLEMSSNSTMINRSLDPDDMGYGSQQPSFEEETSRKRNASAELPREDKKMKVPAVPPLKTKSTQKSANPEGKSGFQKPATSTKKSAKPAEKKAGQQKPTAKEGTTIHPLAFGPESEDELKLGDLVWALKPMTALRGSTKYVYLPGEVVSDENGVWEKTDSLYIRTQNAEGKGKDGVQGTSEAWVDKGRKSVLQYCCSARLKQLIGRTSHTIPADGTLINIATKRHQEYLLQIARPFTPT